MRLRSSPARGSSRHARDAHAAELIHGRGAGHRLQRGEVSRRSARALRAQCGTCASDDGKMTPHVEPPSWAAYATRSSARQRVSREHASLGLSAPASVRADTVAGLYGEHGCWGGGAGRRAATHPVKKFAASWNAVDDASPPPLIVCVAVVSTQQSQRPRRRECSRASA
jgi:hypothetical protein